MEEILEPLRAQIDHELKILGFGEKWRATQMYKIKHAVQKLEPVMAWIKNVVNDPIHADAENSARELCHRVEDVLQRFSIEFSRMMSNGDQESGLEAWLTSWLGNLLVGMNPNLLVDGGNTVRNISEKVSDLETDIQIIIQMFTSMKTQDASVNSNAINGLFTCRNDHPVVGLGSFVGRQDDLWTLETQIYKLNPTICVWGEKGFGKTTLAWRFYTSSQIKLCFDGRVWVTLTKECPVETIRLDILEQLGQSSLCELENCLIVLDNVEGILQWEAIFDALSPHVGPRTKILLTTCNGKVAQHQQVGFSHKLEPMKVDEGWELLKKHAFPNEAVPDFGMFYELGKEMVRKCHFIPQNISNIGRNLSCKTTLDGWHTVNDNFYHYLSIDHQSAEFNHSFKELSSKYHNLSYNLRQCFLYSGCFTGQKKSIRAEELTLLWIGECMVFPKDQKRQVPLIHTAENYLWELRNKGMLKLELLHFTRFDCKSLNLCYIDKDVQEFSLHGRVKETSPLKVVDFRDDNLSKLDSLSTLNVEFFDDNGPKLDSLSTLNLEACRLVIHFNKCKYYRKETKAAVENILEAMTQIQSLVFLNHDTYDCKIDHLKFNFAKLKVLRVAHFVRCTFDGKALPKGLDELLKLRYLGLSQYNSRELSIPRSKLSNLNILNLGVHVPIGAKVQNALSQMTQLQHLCLPHQPHWPYKYGNSNQSVKLKLDALTELETLIGFNDHIHDVSSLYKLQKLRHLVAYAYSNDSVGSIIKFIESYGTPISTNLWINFVSPKELAILSTVLMCHNVRELTLTGVGISKFPNCMERLSSTIIQLNLISCSLEEDPMEALGRIPNLRRLILGNMHFKFGMRVNEGGFQNLEHLEFQYLPNLRTWEVNVGAMPRLSTLIIKRCQNLDCIPDGLASVSTLKMVMVELTRKMLSDGLGARYRQIFSFVPFPCNQRNGGSLDWRMDVIGCLDERSFHLWNFQCIRVYFSKASSPSPQNQEVGPQGDIRVVDSPK